MTKRSWSADGALDADRLVAPDGSAVFSKLRLRWYSVSCSAADLRDGLPAALRTVLRAVSPVFLRAVVVLGFDRGFGAAATRRTPAAFFLAPLGAAADLRELTVLAERADFFEAAFAVDLFALDFFLVAMVKRPPGRRACNKQGRTMLCASSDLFYIRCLWSLLALDYLEFDLVTFSERLEAIRIDCAVMNEHIGTAFT
jgi:hypothetical protein